MRNKNNPGRFYCDLTLNHHRTFYYLRISCWRFILEEWIDKHARKAFQGLRNVTENLKDDLTARNCNALALELSQVTSTWASIMAWY